eukprot:TRINITY_DN54695_c0_g1_i1.p2 TRINITY_DN54695_c0_g1~~TRINITY_DN54695_c0_g1_i1.p2  ORF type:complete len:334 (+),score=7.39 TRINITY_DN54695_c0_g1_i1:116-1117(+)
MLRSLVGSEMCIRDRCCCSCLRPLPWRFISWHLGESRALVETGSESRARRAMMGTPLGGMGAPQTARRWRSVSIVMVGAPTQRTRAARSVRTGEPSGTRRGMINVTTGTATTATCAPLSARWRVGLDAPGATRSQRTCASQSAEMARESGTRIVTMATATRTMDAPEPVRRKEAGSVRVEMDRAPTHAVSVSAGTGSGHATSSATMATQRTKTGAQPRARSSVAVSTLAMVAPRLQLTNATCVAMGHGMGLGVELRSVTTTTTTMEMDATRIAVWSLDTAARNNLGRATTCASKTMILDPLGLTESDIMWSWSALGWHLQHWFAEYLAHVVDN